MGAKVTSSVSKNTDILLAGERLDQANQGSGIRCKNI